MSKHSLSIAIGAVTALSLSAGAWAQKGGGDSNDLIVDFRKTVKLSGAEMSSQADKYIASIEKTRNRVLDLQKGALRKSDVTKANCVRDRAQKITGHYVVAKQAREELGRSIGNDPGETQQQFTRITILQEKVNTLGTEAEGCIGEDVSYVGATKVDVEIDPTVPREDPTAEPLPTLSVTLIPEGSPFL